MPTVTVVEGRCPSPFRLAIPFSTTFWSMPTATAEGWIEPEGGIGEVCGETRL